MGPNELKLEAKSLEPIDERLLDPNKVRIWRSDDGRVRMEIADERCVLHVKVARCFPLSHPQRYIGFRDEDDKDIGTIVEPSELDPESQCVVEEELRKRYFVPIITRIHEIKEEFGVAYWRVDTDKGPREFVVRGLHDDIHELDGNRVLIVDVDGNRFDIPDYTALDPKSYALIEKIL
ncbi:MAG: DUF1854 domain-containing protein [Armatimonadota bacterium]